MKKFSVVMLLMGLFSCNMFASNLSQNKKLFLSDYFAEFSIQTTSMSFKLKKTGVRYKLQIANKKECIANYSGKITIKKGETVRLVSRGNSLIISSNEYLVNNKFKKLELKKLINIVPNIYLISQKVDLRSIGKSLQENDFFLFLVKELSLNRKQQLSQIIATKQVQLIFKNEKFIIVKATKINRAGQIKKNVRMPTKEDLKQKAIIAKILWSDGESTSKEQQTLFEIVKTYPYDDIKVYALNVAVAKNCKNLAKILDAAIKKNGGDTSEIAKYIKNLQTKGDVFDLLEKNLKNKSLPLREPRGPKSYYRDILTYKLVLDARKNKVKLVIPKGIKFNYSQPSLLKYAWQPTSKAFSYLYLLLTKEVKRSNKSHGYVTALSAYEKVFFNESMSKIKDKKTPILAKQELIIYLMSNSYRLSKKEQQILIKFAFETLDSGTASDSVQFSFIYGLGYMKLTIEQQKKLKILKKEFDDKYFQKPKNKYLNETINKMLNYKSSNVADSNNPYYKELLNKAPLIPEYININQNQYLKPQLPLEIV